MKLSYMIYQSMIQFYEENPITSVLMLGFFIGFLPGVFIGIELFINKN